MGLEHMKNPPVSQGENQNYCWAASLSWWLKAVFNRNYSVDDLIDIYDKWISWEADDNFGALNEQGMSRLAHDQRWHLYYDQKKSDKITIEYLTKVLSRSPVMVAYYEPRVKGY